MQLLLDIDDKKAPFILELLHNFSFVTAVPLSPEQAMLIEEFKVAIENVNLVKEGKLKAKPLSDLLNEL